MITDEYQFKAESRKLAAHLADPEVEVQFLNLFKDINHNMHMHPHVSFSGCGFNSYFAIRELKQERFLF